RALRGDPARPFARRDVSPDRRAHELHPVGGICARRARHRRRDPGARIRAGGARARGEHAAHPPAPCRARGERVRDRRVDARDPRLHSGRERSLAPRPRHPGAEHELGISAVGRAEPDEPRPLPVDPGTRGPDRRHDDGLQLPRRPDPRPARPARDGGKMSGAAGTAFDAGTRGAAASERADERSAGAAGDPLLDVRDLAVAFETPRGTVRAVDGVSFAIARGATLGLVGESGSGKSVTSLAILRLLDESARILGGEVWREGRNLLELPESELREVRGGRIAMIFQEPSTSLDPVFTVGSQIVEAIRLHRPVGRRAAWAEAVEALRMVEIPDPERRVRSYPHELSGEMKQRVMIAIALSCRPALLIADEPTTALDVTIQAQVLALLRDLKQRLGMSM